MGAARYFRQVLRDFAALDTAAPLVALAERALADEEKHGHWGRDWAVFFGHPDSSDPVASRTKPFALPGLSERSNRVVRVAFCALTETVGCHVLAAVRPRITFEPLRNVNREHLGDEVVHARIGWSFLATLEGADRELVRHTMPILLRLLPQACCEGPEDNRYDHLIPWGYFTPDCLHAAHRQALREVILPGLDHLGLSPTRNGAAA